MAALMMLKFFGPLTVPSAIGGFAERYAINMLSAPENYIPVISELVKPIQPAIVLNTFTISKAVGLVPLVNLVGSGLLMIYFGMRVGGARREYGVELPDMYAKGDDEKSKKFNCVQRGHQNALETHGIFSVLSIVAGLRHPLLTVALGELWMAARLAFFEGYCKGVDERYGKKIAMMHWYATVSLACLSASTCAGLLGLF